MSFQTCMSLFYLQKPKEDILKNGFLTKNENSVIIYNKLLFQNHFMFFLLWNIKGEIVQNDLVAL